MSGASVDSSCLTTTLTPCALDKTRSNSLSTRGCGERMQTDSLELVRLVATVCQRSENCPKGQVSWKGLFSNCYVTGRVLFRWVRWADSLVGHRSCARRLDHPETKKGSQACLLR